MSKSKKVIDEEAEFKEADESPKVKSEKSKGSSEVKSEDQEFFSQEDFKPGQKYLTPSPGNGDRVFYETLLEQRPDSEMAQEWCILYGVLEWDQAEKLYRQICKRKGKQVSMPSASTTKKSTTTSSSTSKSSSESSSVSTTKSETTHSKKKSRIIDDSNEDFEGVGMEYSGKISI